MAHTQTVRHVPWTCKWGRFGGPVSHAETSARGFVFWTCGHPEEPEPRPLTRGSCDTCTKWELREDSDA